MKGGAGCRDGLSEGGFFFGTPHAEVDDMATELGATQETYKERTGGGTRIIEGVK